jgi:hypothetical protein
MVHTRETRPSASEIKFVIDSSLAPRVSAWARKHLKADPHGTGVCEDEYETSTLYFDTRDFDVFHRRRSHGRAKYRVRRYGGADTVFFERKLRRPGILVKRRTVDATEMVECLNSPTLIEGWSGEWFHRRLLLRKLRPVCQVSYHRMARVLMCGEGLARFTLDSQLRAVAIDRAQYSSEPGSAFLLGRVVLELKYQGYLPVVYRHLVGISHSTPEALRNTASAW